MNTKKKLYAWYTHHLECQEAKGVCKFEECPGQKRMFFNTKGSQRSPRPHDTKYKCMKCSIENKKNMYFCNDVKRGETTVNRCHLLYHEKNYCTNTTTTDDTDDDTDDDN